MAKATVKKKSKIALQKEAERKAVKKLAKIPVKKIPPPPIEEQAPAANTTQPAPVIEETPPPIADEITEPVIDAPPVIEEPVIEEEEPVIEVEEEQETTKGFKEGKRNPMTGMFTKEEREYIDIHLQARITAGLSKDQNHFIRQCVNFAINFTPAIGWTFGRADITRQYFE